MLLKEHERTIFTDREHLLAALHRNAGLTLQGTCMRLALVGDRRIGKTMLAQRFADELYAQHSPLIPIYFNVADNLSLPSVFAMRLLVSLSRSFVRSNGWPERQGGGVLSAAPLLEIADQTREETIIATARKVAREMDKDRPDERMVLETTLACLEQTAQDTGRQLLLILDEFHNVTQLDSFPRIKDSLGVLGQALRQQKNVSYLAASSNTRMMQRTVQSETSPLFGQFRIVHVPPFDLAATTDFCRKSLPEHLQQPEIITRLFAFTSGHPFYLRVLTAALGRFDKLEARDDILDQVIYEELFIREGRIYLFFLHRLETALAEARGKTTLRSVLLVLAEGGRQTLSEIAVLLKRTPGEVRSYLKRLADCELIDREGRLYSIVDPILALWIKFTILEPVPECHEYKEAVERYLDRLAEQAA